MIASTRTRWAEIVGSAHSTFEAAAHHSLDELVFDAVHRALRDARLRKSDVDLSVTASMDVYDGRSISSGLTNSAAAGYLADAIRVEGDSGQAINDAVAAIVSGDAEVSVAVGAYSPEVGGALRSGTAHLDHLAFDPLFERPVGLTREVSLAMHAARALRDGSSIEEFAHVAATLSERAGDHGYRPATTVAEALASPLVADPLREAMLPAYCGGVVAIVFASPPRAARCATKRVGIVGTGAGANRADAGSWVADPARGADQAYRRALAMAGRSRQDVSVWEYTALSSPLHEPVGASLGAPPIASDSVLSAGGALKTYPGLANGALRLIDAVRRLEHAGAGTLAVIHSADGMTGLARQQHTVALAEVIR